MRNRNAALYGNPAATDCRPNRRRCLSGRTKMPPRLCQPPKRAFEKCSRFPVNYEHSTLKRASAGAGARTAGAVARCGAGVEENRAAEKRGRTGSQLHAVVLEQADGVPQISRTRAEYQPGRERDALHRDRQERTGCIWAARKPGQRSPPSSRSSKAAAGSTSPSGNILATSFPASPTAQSNPSPS